MRYIIIFLLTIFSFITLSVSASVIYDCDNGLKIIYNDDGTSTVIQGLTLYTYYNNSCGEVHRDNISWNGTNWIIDFDAGRLVLYWDGLYAFDHIVNPDTDEILSYWDFWHVESLKTTGQDMWQEEIPSSNTFEFIDSKTIKRSMNLASGGRLNITYKVRDGELKYDINVTAGYNRDYKLMKRTDMPASQGSLDNNSKRFNPEFLDIVLFWDYTDIPEYCWCEGNEIGFNVSHGISQSGNKYFMHVEMGYLYSGTSKGFDPSWTIGTGGNAWNGNADLYNVTEDLGDHYLKTGVFRDNFNDGDHDWQINDGTWDASELFLNRTGSQTGWGRVLRFNNLTNINLQCSVKILGGPDWIGFSIIRYLDSNNFYYGVIYDNTNLLRLREYTAGSPATIDEDAVTIDTNVWYTFNMKAYGSSLSTSINGVSSIGSDSTLTNGYYGLGSYGALISFDNVVAYKINSVGGEFLSGNATIWYDAGANNETASLDINFSSIPTNTNYSVYYRTNGTGAFSQIGTANSTANQTIQLSPTYQNTDVRVYLYGNLTATPELISVTYNTQAASGEVTCGWNSLTNVTHYENGTFSCSPTNGTADANFRISFIDNAVNDFYTYNLTIDTATNKEYNETSNNESAKISITLLGMNNDANYSVDTYYNNGTKWQSMWVLSNGTGALNYNVSGFSYPRYVIVGTTTPTTPVIVIAAFATVIISGAVFVLRRVIKV